MDSREPNHLHQSSQSRMQSQPQIMLGVPNSYGHGFIYGNGGGGGGGGGGSSLDMTTAAAMMQNHSFSLNSVGPSMEMGSLNPQFPGGSMQQDGHGHGHSIFGVDQGRKKRGRPRKYSPENNINLGLASDSGPSSPFRSNQDESNVRNPGSESGVKKSRGRPPSLGKKQLDALGSYGIGFTPHVISVEPGEDIAEKVTAFSKEGPRTVCIMSAYGSISKATLLQPSTSTGVISYEGRFQIVSLTGAFRPSSEGNAVGNRVSPLCVSLAGSDGRVLGGGVGKLIAATTVTVIVGSFIADGKKLKTGNSTTSPTPLNVQEQAEGAAAGGNSQSEGRSSDSSRENDEVDSPYDHNSAPRQEATGGVHNMGGPYSHPHLEWGNPTMKMFHN